MKDGVLIIDKPADMSSARAVGHVKAYLQAQKVGHAGALDPFATGVLVCLINRATRLAQFFLKGDKCYDAELFLGVATDTQDGTGKVTAQRALPAFSHADLEQVFKRFAGTIEQVPPIYSALKHEGVALYKWARRGRPVEKPARKVRIAALTIHEIMLPKVRFSVTCSSGTYIRTLCADIGKALGCGGHLSRLRRTMSSGFGIEEALRLESLGVDNGSSPAATRLIPPGDALRDMPALMADPPTVVRIKSGAVIGLRDFTDLPSDATVMKKGEKGIHYKVIDTDNNLIAVVALERDQKRLTYCGVFA
jgi:tRNA pseudouridine55 synthase